MKAFVSAALVMVVTLFATGCGEKEEAKYVAPLPAGGSARKVGAREEL